MPADVVAEVAVVAADALVAAGAERVRALAGEDDHADLRVVARAVERLRQLEQRLRAEGVAHLGPADGDLGDAVAAELEADVRVLAGGLPGHGHAVRVVARPPARASSLSAAGWTSGTGCRARQGAVRTASPSRRRGRRSPTASSCCARCGRRGRCTCAPSRAGARVALALEPGVPFVEALHACLLLGAAAMPVDPRLGPAERAAGAARRRSRGRAAARRRRRVRHPRAAGRRRHRAGRPHVGHDGRSRADRADVRQRRGEHPRRAAGARASATTSAGSARCRSSTSAA